MHNQEECLWKGLGRWFVNLPTGCRNTELDLYLKYSIHRDLHILLRAIETHRAL